MADDAKTQTPPAQAIDVAAITRQITEQVTSALSTQINERLDRFRADLATPQDGRPSAANAKALTSDDVLAAVDKALSARDDADARRRAIETKRAEIARAKLGDDAELARLLPETDDEGKLNAAADLLAAKLKPARGDFGGQKDGGTPASQQPVDTAHMDPADRIARGLASAPTAPTAAPSA